jgi:hypothetical protein
MTTARRSSIPLPKGWAPSGSSVLVGRLTTATSAWTEIEVDPGK